MVEPIVVKRDFSAEWTKGLKLIDLTELARLRFIEKWTIEQLSKYYNCSRSTVLNKLKRAKEI